MRPPGGLKPRPTTNTANPGMVAAQHCSSKTSGPEATMAPKGQSAAARRGREPRSAAVRIMPAVAQSLRKGAGARCGAADARGLDGSAARLRRQRREIDDIVAAAPSRVDARRWRSFRQRWSRAPGLAKCRELVYMVMKIREVVVWWGSPCLLANRTIRYSPPG